MTSEFIGCLLFIVQLYDKYNSYHIHIFFLHLGSWCHKPHLCDWNAQYSNLIMLAIWTTNNCFHELWWQ